MPKIEIVLCKIAQRLTKSRKLNNQVTQKRTRPLASEMEQNGARALHPAPALSEPAPEVVERTSEKQLRDVHLHTQTSA